MRCNLWMLKQLVHARHDHVNVLRVLGMRNGMVNRLEDVCTVEMALCTIAGIQKHQTVRKDVYVVALEEARVVCL